MSFETTIKETPVQLDYSLTGINATLAIEKGLAEADWYQCDVERETMRTLLERRDGPAIRDTILWFTLLLFSGYATYVFRHSSLAICPYALYAVLYASTSDSRWHESGHGTAFKTDWMNSALYEISSFMVMRESVIWRWSHNRHHSDTIIVGRDPEIAVPRPPQVKSILLSFLNIENYPKYFRKVLLHSFGYISSEEKTYIPDTEFRKIFRNARIYFAIYSLVVALSVYSKSLLPLFYVGLTNLFGTWLLVIYGLTQHTGLAENVLDHRLNCRTISMNAVNRFFYWNMNYHIEHHMYPLVPYHALPLLHEVVKNDCPEAYPSLLTAWREIIPAVLRQIKDPAYHVKRRLPPPPVQLAASALSSAAVPNAEGWIPVCPGNTLRLADVLRFDYGRKTFALYRDETGLLYATDGMCTHGNVHLSGGLVKGTIIECPKHNGRFNLLDGSPSRAPICRGLATYPIQERNGQLHLNVLHPGGCGARAQRTTRFRVVCNTSVATFIKELVLEPLEPSDKISFAPGDYMQIEIPEYDTIRFSDLDIPEPFRSVWQTQHLFGLKAHNPEGGHHNNYSLASNLATENTLRFNVRIATPPPGQACPPGVGSSYVFSLKPGDVVVATGPFGDFHIKPTQREMVYIGGGAGMAPLRAHLSHLLETQRTARKVSFWYGARSGQEIFYDTYFGELAQTHSNFSFHLALSSPLPDDHWSGHTGFIHEVLLERYLRNHPHAANVEYYLCGPPMMIKATTRMLAEIGVPPQQIAYDEF